MCNLHKIKMAFGAAGQISKLVALWLKTMPYLPFNESNQKMYSLTYLRHEVFEL